MKKILRKIVKLILLGYLTVLATPLLAKNQSLEIHSRDHAKYNKLRNYFSNTDIGKTHRVKNCICDCTKYKSSENHLHPLF